MQRVHGSGVSSSLIPQLPSSGTRARGRKPGLAVGITVAQRARSECVGYHNSHKRAGHRALVESLLRFFLVG